MSDQGSLPALHLLAPAGHQAAVATWEPGRSGDRCRIVLSSQQQGAEVSTRIFHLGASLFPSRLYYFSAWTFTV